jgi:hypothetical protein
MEQSVKPLRGRFVLPVLIGCAAAVAPITPAQAADLLVEVEGAVDLRFTIDREPAVHESWPLRFSAGMFNDIGGEVSGPFEVIFYSPSWGGGLDVLGAGGSDYWIYGPLLFSGTTTAPVMRTGVFAMNDGYTVTISAVAAAVPEPGSWALLVLGFGAVGAAMRRRGGNAVRASATVRYSR